MTNAASISRLLREKGFLPMPQNRMGLHVKKSSGKYQALVSSDFPQHIEPAKAALTRHGYTVTTLDADCFYVSKATA